MTWTYERKLQPSEITVVCVCLDRRRNQLEPEMARSAERYGFRLRWAGNLVDASSVLAGTGPRRIGHLIVTTDCGYEQSVVNDVCSRLGEFDSASLAFEYSDPAAMLAAEAAIAAAKRRHAALNILRPVVTSCGKCVVTNEKVADNAVCDTVRVKYNPICVSAEADPSAAALHFFEAASRLVEKYRLFHRDPCDGYIAFKDCKESLLITATRTAKVGLDLSRISRVLLYNEEANTVHFGGRYLPSSDSVEAFILMRERTSIRALLHVHASALFTRNARYRDRIRVPVLPYGESPLGHSLARAACEDTGFVIMEEHGEVFWSGRGDTLLEFVESQVEQARSPLSRPLQGVDGHGNR